MPTVRVGRKEYYKVRELVRKPMKTVYLKNEILLFGSCFPLPLPSIHGINSSFWSM